MPTDIDPLMSLGKTLWDRAQEQKTKDIAIPDPFTDDDIDDPHYYYDRMYRGYHYDLFPAMASWVSRPVLNKPFIGVESNTTLLTDSRPSISVAPREEMDTELAEVTQVAIDYWWDLQNASVKDTMAVKASRIFGVGWLGLQHESDGEHLYYYHTESVTPDPDCVADGDFDPTYLFYEYRSSIGELKKRFKDVDEETWKGCDPNWVMHMPLSNRVQRDRYEESVNPARVVNCYQLWLKDGTELLVENDALLKGKTVKLSKPKYKNRYRVITYAGGQVIEDKESPYQHGQVPFTPVHCYPVPGKFWSMGDIQQIFALVIMRNRYQQYLYDQTMRSGGGIILVGNQSGIDPNKISNVPIQIVPCRDVTQFRIESFPAPSRHIMDALAELDKAIDDILGIHDISRGAYTPGNKTAQEVGVLAESDRTRIRLASRLHANALERIGRQLLSNWAQWGDFQWMLKLSGKDEEMNPTTDSEYVQFSGKQLKREKLNPSTEKTSIENIALDLKVGETSMLPGSRNELRQLVDMLDQKGLVDGLTVLKTVGWPNPEGTYAKSPRGKQETAPPPDPNAQMQMPPEAMAPPEAMPPGEMPPEMMMPPDQSMMPPMMEQPMGATGNPEQDLMMMVMQASEQSGLPPEQILMLMGEEGGMEGAVL